MAIGDKLKKIEARLQRLFEQQAPRLIQSTSLPFHLVDHLVAAISADIKQDGERLLAPNHFMVHMPPEAAREIQAAQSTVAALAQSIAQVGKEAGLTFPTPPTITILEDQDLASGTVKIKARTVFGTPESTQAFSTEEALEPSPVPPNAFLIVTGNRVFPLIEPVINIGRRVDNHLVIDDLAVSRIHAQLRAIDDHFVIFDLDSTGGTFVNGQKINRCVLYPGDVIALASVQLVYGQDSPKPLDEVQEYTQPIPSDQKKTITIDKTDKTGNQAG